MPLLRPGTAVYSPWSIGNYDWGDPLILIVAVATLFVGLFLFASYLKSRKIHLLLWAFSLFGFWIFYHQMLMGGSYESLIGAGFGYDVFSNFTAMLLALIPGLLAAGLCFDKDKKLGLYYTLYVLVLTMLYIFFSITGNAGFVDNTKLIATIILFAVQLPSVVLIIALPIMKEGPLFPKNLVAVSGGFMATINIIMFLLMLAEALGIGFNPIEGATIDILCMLVPFLLLISNLCLIYGILGTKDYGFEVSNVEFEE